MYRIDNATSNPTPPPYPAPAAGRHFTSGDPATNLPATIVDAWFLDQLQEEICSVVEGAGLPLTKGTTQLLGAIYMLTNGVSAFSGALAGLTGSAPGDKTASWTNGISVLSFNGATTGVDGMDTGATPVSGDLSIYSVLNLNTRALHCLGCAGATSNGPVYTGAHMPPGYISVGLLSSVKTDPSGNLRMMKQWERCIAREQLIVVAGAAAPPFTPISLVSFCPANTIAVSGQMQINGNGAYEIASDAAGNGNYSVGTQTSDIVVPYPMTRVAAQTLYYGASSGTPVATITASAYRF